MERAKLYGVEVQAQTCGRMACENDAIAFWQSRMTTDGRRAEPLQLTDIPQLAKDIRRASVAAACVAPAAAPVATIADLIRLTIDAWERCEGVGGRGHEDAEGGPDDCQLPPCGCVLRGSETQNYGHATIAHVVSCDLTGDGLEVTFKLTAAWPWPRRTSAPKVDKP